MSHALPVAFHFAVTVDGVAGPGMALLGVGDVGSEGMICISATPHGGGGASSGSG
jgi:hypothetical protein